MSCVRFCGVLQLHVQHVSLSTHVNFDSVVLSGLALSSRLFTFTQGTLSYVHFCPRPRSEHMSMGQARDPPTLGTTLRVYPVLLCPLGPCNRRICVIASETVQDMDISWAPLHLGAPFPLFDTVQIRKPRSTIFVCATNQREKGGKKRKVARGQSQINQIL